MLGTGSFFDSRPGPVAVISPHLDDAVFSCGLLLASRPRSVVVTVFAGSPAIPHPLTEWDRSSGFIDGENIILRRRQEDSAALAALDAHPPIWLDFVDSQYRRAIDEMSSSNAVPDSHLLAEVCNAIKCELLKHGSLKTVFVPAGIYHPDHSLTRDAALSLRLDPLFVRHRWVIYEEWPYRIILEPLLRQEKEKVASLIESQCQISANQHQELEMPDALQHAKRQAVQKYSTQLRALTAFARKNSPSPSQTQTPMVEQALWTEHYWVLRSDDHERVRTDDGRPSVSCNYSSGGQS